MSNMGVIEPMEHMSKNCSDAYEMDGVRLGLCVFEIFINVCVIGASAPFAKVVTAITSFTTTMKVLFLNMLFAAVGIAMTRLFILIPQYISINQLYNAGFVAPVQVFHDVSINVNTLITMAITMEFFFYSKWPNPKRLTTILLSSINTFWPWITTIVMYWMEKHEIVKTVPLFAVLEVVNFLSWAIFLGLYFYNRKRYKTMHASTLDEKYQVTVKIRVLRTFLFLSVLTTVRNFLTMTLLIVIITYVVPECLYYAHLYCDHAYDITVALYSVLFIVPLILTQNEFKKQFMKFVDQKCFGRKFNCAKHCAHILSSVGPKLEPEARPGWPNFVKAGTEKNKFKNEKSFHVEFAIC
uniref:Gustatory receptor n=1 Tax=Globodera rostochiensis TaxID=31243 RepID=A0A914I170_GLORO